MTERVEDFIEVRRHAERGSYERSVIDAVLDEAFFCTVGFVDDGRPVVIPTIHVRVGDMVVLHGSPASRMLRTLKTGEPCAIGVTIFDGLVLARSVFNHSMNYRSVVLLDCVGNELVDRDEKWEAMHRLTDKIVPGRWDDARRPSDKEFKGTTLVSFPIQAASAKIRSGPRSTRRRTTGCRYGQVSSPTRSAQVRRCPTRGSPRGSKCRGTSERNRSPVRFLPRRGRWHGVPEGAPHRISPRGS